MATHCDSQEIITEPRFNGTVYCVSIYYVYTAIKLSDSVRNRLWWEAGVEDHKCSQKQQEGLDAGH